MPDVDLEALKRSLYARRETAVTVPYEKRELKGAPATEHGCHNNADLFVIENPDHKSVRGWLVFDLHKTSEGDVRLCRFTSHSVVEAPDGTMFDITPSRASQRYPFLRHEGPEGEFEAIVLAGHVHIEYQI
jgi:hypothetical protein